MADVHRKIRLLRRYYYKHKNNPKKKADALKAWQEIRRLEASLKED